MGLFDSKNNDEIYKELGRLESQVELLKELNAELKQDKLKLQEQISNLQDAIIALKNPESYKDLVNDRLASNWKDTALGEVQKTWNLSDEQLAFLREYQEAADRPFFKDGTDIESLLIQDKLAMAHGVIESEPTHDNMES